MRPLDQQTSRQIRQYLALLILTGGLALVAGPLVGSASAEDRSHRNHIHEPIMFKDWTDIRHLPDGNDRIVREQARQGEYFRRWEAIHKIVGDQHTSRLSRELLSRRGLGTALFDKDYNGDRAQKAFDGVDTLKVLIVRIGFEENRNPSLTTVDPSGDFNYVAPENQDDLLIDPPPHNRDFYQSHLAGLSEYYQYQSGGKLFIEGTVLPEEQEGSYKLSDIADYGPGNGGFWSLQSLEALVRDMINAGDAGTAGTEFDFSDFDDDNPLTYIIFVHAGSDWQSDINGDSPNDIPTFFVTLGESEGLASGGELSECSVIPETTDQDGYPGSIAAAFYHEFGHALGLPDVYNTSTGFPSVGIWDLMDSGTNLPVTLGHITAENDTIIKTATGVLPPSLSVWNKWFLGWVEVEEVDGRPEDYKLPAVQVPYSQYPMWDIDNGDFNSSYPQAIRVGVSPREFFLLENRYVPPAPNSGGTYTPYSNLVFEKDDETQVILYLAGERPPGNYTNSGMYDYFMPNGGLLAWHVNMDRIEANLADNTINAFGDGLRLVEADGIQDIGVLDASVLGWYGSARDPFGNNGLSIDLLPDGTPTSRNFDRSWSGVSLTDIRPNGSRSSSVMRFGASVEPVTPGFPWEVASLDSAEAVAGGGSAGPRQLDASTLTPVNVSTQSILLFSDGPGDNWGGGNFPSSLYAIRTDGFAPYLPLVGKSEGAILGLDSPLAGPPVVLDESATNPHVVFGTKAGTLGCVELSTSAQPVLLWSVSVGDSLHYAPIAGLGGVSSKLIACVVAPDSLSFRLSTTGEFAETVGYSSRIISQPKLFRSNPDYFRDALLLGTEDEMILTSFNDPETNEVYPWESTPEGMVHMAVIDELDGLGIVAFDDNGALQPTLGFNLQVGAFDDFDSPLVCEPATADIDADGHSDIILATAERIFAFHADGIGVRGFPSRLFELFPLPDTTRIVGPLIVADATGDAINEIFYNTDGGHLIGLIATGEMLNKMPFRWNDHGQPGMAYGEGAGNHNQLWMISPGGIGTQPFTRNHINGRVVTYDLATELESYQYTSRWLGPLGGSTRSGSVGYPRDLEASSPVAAEMDRVIMYPNPVHESDVTVRFYAHEAGDALFVLYNLQGEEVQRVNFVTVADSVNEKRMDVAGLASGLYLGRLVFPGANGTETKTITLAVER